MGSMRLVVDTGEGAPAEAGVDGIGALLADGRNRLWLDVSDPGPAEVELLRREFGFHELALEEVTQPHERPRCNAYAGYYFIVVYAGRHDGAAFAPGELNLFWGPNYLVTIHRRVPAVLAVLEKARGRWERHDGRHALGVASLVYTLFDSLVDGYFQVEDHLRGQIQAVRGAIFTGGEEAAASLFRLREELLRVPRLLAPTIHVLSEVLRRDDVVPPALRPWFADVQDHAVHVMAELDTWRDLLAAALDVHVFYAFNRLGLIMKRLTAVTVIIMVPNFVAGIYGMNFAHLFPPSEWPLGWFMVVALLAVMVIWGFIHSRILGWL
jgi:magnesium transporter